MLGRAQSRPNATDARGRRFCWLGMLQVMRTPLVPGIAPSLPRSASRRLFGCRALQTTVLEREDRNIYYR